jgi:tetratricopeptide (TPR) repeat protein
VGVLLSQVYEKLKDFSKAEDALLRLTGGKVNLAVRMDGWRALAAFWKDHPEQLHLTVKNSEAAADKDPKDAEALERLAQIYTDIKPDPKKADVYMTRLVDLGSKDVEGRLRLASLYERQKQYEKAIKLYDGLIPDTTKAGGWELQVRIAVLMVAAGKKDEAVAMVEKNLVPKAQTALETAGLAGFYANADLPQKAEDAFVKAASLSQSPEDVSTCMLSAAESCRKRKDYAKAEQYVRALLKQYKDNKQVRTQSNAALVKLYDEQGRLGDLNLD